MGAAAIARAGDPAATTWFGSSLNHEPANAGASCDQNAMSTRMISAMIGVPVGP